MPQASCGVNGNYYSSALEITFVTSDTDTCIKSNEDYTAGEIGSDCNLDKDGCDTGLSCAVEIHDGDGND